MYSSLQPAQEIGNGSSLVLGEDRNQITSRGHGGQVSGRGQSPQGRDALRALCKSSNKDMIIEIQRVNTIKLKENASIQTEPPQARRAIGPVDQAKENRDLRNRAEMLEGEVRQLKQTCDESKRERSAASRTRWRGSPTPSES